MFRFLLEESKNNEEVRRLLKSLEIHILPSLNPDGYSLKTRQYITYFKKNSYFRK